MSTRYGPAGIFSTDCPVSDAMQIAEEEGPLEKLYEEELSPEEDQLQEDVLWADCPNEPWYASENYWKEDEEDLERAREALQTKHDQECSCGATVSFS